MEKIKRYLEPVIHAILWITGYILVVEAVNNIGYLNKENGTIILPVTLGTLVNIVIFYSTAFYFLPTYSSRDKIFRLILVMSVILILFSLAETGFDYLFFNNYYSSEEETFNSQLLVNVAINGFIMSLALGYGLIKLWVKNEKQNQQLKEEKLKAELDFLKAQVNPHFLFNVLNTAFSSASAHGDERTASIIERLANMMRYMLYESNVKLVSLEKEISYLKNFIELQKLRLPAVMKEGISFEIKGDLSNVYIAPLLLIPFVENAFKHGIRLDQQSDIKIQLEIKSELLIFSVENSMITQKNGLEKGTGGIGLSNLRKRLALLYPNMHEIKTLKKESQYSAYLSLTLKKQE